jgi:hypothetical protein
MRTPYEIFEVRFVDLCASGAVNDLRCPPKRGRRMVANGCSFPDCAFVDLYSPHSGWQILPTVRRVERFVIKIRKALSKGGCRAGNARQRNICN